MPFNRLSLNYGMLTNTCSINYFCTNTNIIKMQFELTEEHIMIQQAAREFAQTELVP